MNLLESYKLIKGSLVGLAPAYYPTDRPPPYPNIFGTGFVVREDGIIATNHHVVQWMAENVLPNAPELPAGQEACIAIICRFMQDHWIHVNLPIISFAIYDVFIPADVYYGPVHPDLAFIQVKARGLPTVEFEDSIFLEEGLEIATAGYPLGTDLLTVPGYLHQATPTLRKGIISAVLPFPSPNPHAFMIDVMTQGGASGSPVFVPETARALGMLYAGYDDILCTSQQQPHDDAGTPHGHLVKMPTNISYVVPCRFILDAINTQSIRNLSLPDDAEHIEAIFERNLPNQSVRKTE